MVTKVVTREKLAKNKAKKYKSIFKEDGERRTFEDIGFSTQTVIGYSNLEIVLENFFKYMPITDYEPIEKKRGRRRRIQIPVPIQIMPFGSIICVQHRKDIRGKLPKKKSIKKKETFFLHCITFVIFLDNNKHINVKVYRNGNFQLTGCKSEEHYIQAIVSVYQTMCEVEKWTGEKLFNFVPELANNNNLTVVFKTVMQNNYFSIGFCIYRHKLDYFINKYTNFCSIFEGSISTGVNIKVKFKNDMDTEFLRITYDSTSKEVDVDYANQEEYINFLGDKFKKKPTKKAKHHTFLVFSSGNIIMSSRGMDMKNVFEEMIETLTQNREHFEDQNASFELIQQESQSKPRKRMEFVIED